jgi:bacterioferritin (cytochrome b1)
MDNLMDALQNCYRHELTLLVRYTNFSIVVGGMERLHLAEFFRKNAADCMSHAVKVGAKILALGGAPQGKITESLPSAPQGTEKMLRQALADEQAAVALYGEAAALAKKDLALRETLMHILKDEQASVDELRLILEK